MGIKFSSMTGKLILALALIFVCAPTLMAQDVANGSATATMMAALTVSATDELAFGNIYQGVAKTVAPAGDSAGIFTIAGATNAGVSLNLTLPEYVALNDGSDRMPVSFSDTDLNIDTTALTAGDPTAWAVTEGFNDDPRAVRDTWLAAGTAYVYIGGRITPKIYQTAGAYTGSVILTVMYNGT